MKFSTALFALSSAIGAFALNSFTTPIGNETLTAGDTFIIRWNNTNGGDTVDLLLKKGNASNLETALTISTGLKNVGAVRWFLPQDLYTGSDYALQIINKDNADDINYSPFFTIIGKDPVTTTSTTSSATKSSTKQSTTTSSEASSVEASTTEASSTGEATAAPNSTVSSTLVATSSFTNSTVVASSTGSKSSAASGSSHATSSASASRTAAASGTTTAAGSNGASALSLNNAVVAVGLAGAAFFGL
jgi:hypothetical protein